MTSCLCITCFIRFSKNSIILRVPELLPALDDPRLRLRLLPTLDGSPSRLSSSSSSSSSEPGEDEELFDEKLIPIGGGAAAAAGVVADPDTAAGAITAALGSGGNIPTPGGAWGTLMEEIGIGLLIRPPMPMPIPVETGEITGLMVVAVVVAGGSTKEAEALLPVALLLAAELWRASSSLKNL
jgi:hypothetical protein